MALVIQSTLKLPFLWRFFFKHFFVQPFPNAFPNKNRDLSPHIYLPPKKKQKTHHFLTVDGGNPKQPPGMVLKPCKSLGKLPTSTGERRISSTKAVTLPETNIAPENRPLFQGDSYWKPPFLGATGMLVSGRVSLETSQKNTWFLWPIGGETFHPYRSWDGFGGGGGSHGVRGPLFFEGDFSVFFSCEKKPQKNAATNFWILYLKP